MPLLEDGKKVRRKKINKNENHLVYGVYMGNSYRLVLIAMITIGQALAGDNNSVKALKRSENSENVKRCQKGYSDSKEVAKCISKSDSQYQILGKVATGNNFTPSLTINKNIGFEKKLEFANDPDINLLRQCGHGLRAPTELAYRNEDEIIFRTTISPDREQVDLQEIGYIYKVANESYLFSDRVMNDTFNKYCAKKLNCSFLSKVGNQFIKIKLMSDKRGSNPKIIAFSKLHKNERKKISEGKVNFIPVHFPENQNGYVNAQLSRSIAVAISDDFLIYENALAHNFKITPEAYSQSKNTIESCIELMSSMAPEDKNVITYAKYALDSLNKLNIKSNKDESIDVSVSEEKKYESIGISKK